MAVGILSLEIQIPGCLTLKEKRSQLKPLLHRIHREFNISISETNLQDKRSYAIITAAMVSNDSKHVHATFNHVIGFIEDHFSNLEIVKNSIEII